MEKDNKVLGGIFGILVGIVFSLPWVLCYVYLNIMTSYLAFIIGYGIIWGYKRLNDNIVKSKKIAAYLFISAILIIVFDTFLLIPCLLTLKSGSNLSFEYIKYLYSYNDFLSAILLDGFIAIVFTVIGVLPVYNGIKTDENSSAKTNSYESKLDDAKDDVKKIFAKYNAFDKENAVSKKIIKNELKDLKLKNKNVNAASIDLMKGIVIKKGKKGTWYYSEENEKSFGKKAKGVIIAAIIMGVIAGLSTTFSTNNSSTTNNNVNDSEPVYKLPAIEDVNLTTQKLKNDMSIDILDNMFIYDEEDSKEEGGYVYIYLTDNVKSSVITYLSIYQYYDEFEEDVAIEDLYEYYKSYKPSKDEVIKDVQLTDFNAIYLHVEDRNKEYFYDSYIFIYNKKLYEVAIDFSAKTYDDYCNQISNKIASSVKFGKLI